MGFWYALLAYLAVFSAAVSLLLTRLMIRLAHRFDLVDEPGERKIHTHALPSTGGVAMVGAFLAAIALHLFGVWLLKDTVGAARLAADAIAHSMRAGEAPALRRMVGILVGGIAMFVLGFWDDRRPLGPRPKLIVECAAALLALWCGVELNVFLDTAIITIPVTILWIVGITNAFNMLDNMDGLSGGVAAISAFMLGIIALMQQQFLICAILAVYIGSICGFLRFNLNGARIIMGDAGALFLGYIIACLTVTATFYRPGVTSRWAVMAPVLILGVPIFDVASVVVLRRRAGVPVMQGDQRHFSHRLVRLGLSRSAAVYVIYLTTAVVGLGATQLPYLPPVGVALVLLQGLGIFAIIALLEWAGARAAAGNGNGDG